MVNSASPTSPFSADAATGPEATKWDETSPEGKPLASSLDNAKVSEGGGERARQVCSTAVDSLSDTFPFSANAVSSPGSTIALVIDGSLDRC